MCYNLADIMFEIECEGIGNCPEIIEVKGGVIFAIMKMHDHQEKENGKKDGNK